MSEIKKKPTTTGMDSYMRDTVIPHMTLEQAIKKYRDDIAPYMRGDANEAVYNALLDAAEKWDSVIWFNALSYDEQSQIMDMSKMNPLSKHSYIFAAYRASQEESK